MIKDEETSNFDEKEVFMRSTRSDIFSLLFFTSISSSIRIKEKILESKTSTMVKGITVSYMNSKSGEIGKKIVILNRRINS